MTPLLLLTLARLRQQALRTTLVVVGVALGVAIFVAFNLLRVSIDRSFRGNLEVLAGRAHLEVTGGPSGVPEEIAEHLAGHALVAHSAAVIEATLAIADPQGGQHAGDSLLIVGVDTVGDDYFLGARLTRQVQLDNPMELLQSPDAVLVARSFAARRGLRVGSTFSIATPHGTRGLRVVGMLPEDPEGFSRAYGGDVALMDLPAIEELLGRGMNVDRVQIALKDPGAADAATAALRKVVGDQLRVEPPARRGQRTERLLLGFSSGLLFTSILALLVGALLVYNAVSISVAERTSEIGMLRALGAERRQIARLFLGEAVVLGCLGSVIGVGVGIVLARLLAVDVGQTINALYTRVRMSDLTASPQLVCTALLLGTATSGLAGWLPARLASRMEPLEATRGGALRALPIAERRLTSLGVGALMVSGLLQLLPPGGLRAAAGPPSAVMLLLAFPLLSPMMLRRLDPVLRSLATRLFGVPGRLAVDHIALVPGRAAVTVSTLAMAVALIISVSGFSETIQRSLVDWIQQSVRADVVVSASALFVGPSSTPLQPGLASRLAEIDGVLAVDMLRNRQVELEGQTSNVMSCDTAVYDRFASVRYTEGDPTQVAADMLRGDITISDNMGRRRDLHRGDTIEVRTPTGNQRLRIAGLFIDYSNDNGVARMDRSRYLSLFGDPLVDMFQLHLAPDRDANQVRLEVQRRFGTSYDLRVYTNAELRRAMLGIAGRIFDALRALQLVALLIAMLGAMNTLFASVLDRTRELGILRAVGATRRHVLQLVIAEAVVFGIGAVVIGVPCGLLFESVLVKRINLQATGWAFPWVFPTVAVVQSVSCVMGAAVVAALWPARRATQATPSSVVRAL